ncbi:MAG: hypothetical protein M3Q46_08120 [Verrucomicrobiota bacterium]|nr:hypothetical protein [Verrucomicrobiota bacterium]
MRISLPLLLSFLVVATAEGRIGETSLQFVGRYGPPKDTQLTKIADRSSPLIEGAIHHTYEYQGWKIRAAFLQLDGPAVRMDYQKLSGASNSIQIQDYELQAIAGANTPPGMSWNRTAYDNPNSPSKGINKLVEGFAGDAFGQKMWRRSDGAILWSRSNLIVRLELPIARQYEAQQKAAKEQKARASVPSF